MYSDDLDSVTNNLPDSAKGSLVTYDDTFPLTLSTGLHDIRASPSCESTITR